MACQSCRQQARLLARSLQTTNDLRLSPSTLLFSSSATASTSSTRYATSPSRPLRTRPFTSSAYSAQSRSPSADQPSTPSVSSLLKKSSPSTLSSMATPYIMNNQLDKLYKKCAAAAAYTIPEETRKNDEVAKTPEGEELGIPEGPWLEVFNLSPSFSSWSHVTMLHMYLVVARMRCLERDAARTTQAQFVDNFFFDCERVMHLNHGMASSALRQRYLKDIFMQWRGLIAAYDEGLVKASDRVLAAAVWRNLFKARDDVDVRSLAAVVVWMRLTLRDLELMEVDEIIANPTGVFRRDPRAAFAIVDQPAAELSSLLGVGGADAPAPKVNATN